MNNVYKYYSAYQVKLEKSEITREEEKIKNSNRKERERFKWIKWGTKWTNKQMSRTCRVLNRKELFTVALCCTDCKKRSAQYAGLKKKKKKGTRSRKDRYTASGGQKDCLFAGLCRATTSTNTGDAAGKTANFYKLSAGTHSGRLNCLYWLGVLTL